MERLYQKNKILNSILTFFTMVFCLIPTEGWEGGQRRCGMHVCARVNMLIGARIRQWVCFSQLCISVRHLLRQLRIKILFCFMVSNPGSVAPLCLGLCRDKTSWQGSHGGVNSAYFMATRKQKQTKNGADSWYSFKGLLSLT